MLPPVTGNGGVEEKGWGFCQRRTKRNIWKERDFQLGSWVTMSDTLRAGNHEYITQKGKSVRHCALKLIMTWTTERKATGVLQLFCFNKRIWEVLLIKAVGIWECCCHLFQARDVVSLAYIHTFADAKSRFISLSLKQTDGKVPEWGKRKLSNCPCIGCWIFSLSSFALQRKRSTHS